MRKEKAQNTFAIFLHGSNDVWWLLMEASDYSTNIYNYQSFFNVYVYSLLRNSKYDYYLYIFFNFKYFFATTAFDPEFQHLNFPMCKISHRKGGFYGYLVLVLLQLIIETLNAVIIVWYPTNQVS